MAEALAFTALSAVIQTGISYMFPSDGPRMKDLKITASTYGNVIPETWGLMRVAGNMIWSTPIVENKEKQRAGKGGSYYNQFTYEVDFAMGFSVGPVDSVKRLWADGKLIYDITGASPVTKNTSFKLRVYTGGEKQLPDSLIVADKGVGKTPAYRGLCYCVFEKFLLADFGNRVPQITAEVFRGELKLADSTQLTYENAATDETYEGYLSWSNVLTDFERGYFYGVGGLDTNQGYLRKFEITTGQEVASAVPDFSFTTNDAMRPELVYYNSSYNITRLIGMMSDGSPIVKMDENGLFRNFHPVAQLEPESMQPVSGWGFANTFGNNDGMTPSLSAAARWGPTCVTSHGHEYFLHIGIFEHLALLKMKNEFCPWITFIWGDQQWNGPKIYSNENNIPRYYCSHDRVSEEPTFYATAGAADNFPGSPGFDNIVLYRITMTDGVESIYSFPNPRKDIYTPTEQRWFSVDSGCTVDYGAPGLIFFWREAFDIFWLSKYSFDTGEIVWETRCPPPPINGLQRSLVINSEFAYTRDNKLYVIDTLTGVWKEPFTGDQIDEGLYDPEEIPTPPIDPTGVLPDGFEIELNGDPSNFVRDYRQVYDGYHNRVIATGGYSDDAVVRIGQPDGDGVSLGFIVESLLRKAGLRGKDFRMGPLYDVKVLGYGFARVADVKSAIQELKQIYLFDLVESDGRLVATFRGGTESVRTVKGAILGSMTDGASDFWRESRTMEHDLPMAINFSYFNSTDDYETSMARAKRMVAPLSTMYSPQISTFEANIVFEPTEAKQRAHTMLYTQWAERTRHESRFPWAYMDLDPSDLITVNMDDGRSYFERIHTTELGANFVVEFDTYSQDNGAYISTVVADGGGSGVTPVLPQPLPGVGFVFNTPLLRDTDSSGGAYSVYYSALGKSGDGAFTGATLYRSQNSIDYAALYAETEEVEWGTVVGIVPDAAFGAWALDYETQIRIIPGSEVFELESISDDVLDQGGNLCVIGKEVMQFRDATEQPDGSWIISNLWRGRRGTEYACANHEIAERFVFPTSTTVERQSEALASAGQNRWFKGVGRGKPLAEAESQLIVYYPRDLMPYAPNDLRREIVSNGDIELTWERRTRLGGGLMNLTGTVPLNETGEAYEVYLLDGPFVGDPSTPVMPTNVVRQIDTSTPDFTYTAAMQTEDGHVANLDTLYVVVYQISGVVGRGFPSYRAIESWRFD